MTTIIVKPTDACNARCRYCSAAHLGTASVMSTETLRATFQLFGDWAIHHGQKRLRFIWHGGEPLLMGASFWDEVLRGEQEMLKARGLTVENGIQTNATRITQEFIPMLKQLLGDHGVVGTSADPMTGIRELKGSADGEYKRQWEEAIELLRGARIRYGLVYVVHRLSLPELEPIYRTFRDQHPMAGVRFNPLYRQGRADEPRVWDDLGITAAEWGSALGTLNRAWEADGRPTNVLPFAPWWQLHEKGAWRLSCECSGKCFASHFGVDPKGQVFLCGRSADGDSFNFGNATELTAQALKIHPLRQALANRGVYLKRTACGECPWWNYCHGGCVNDAILENGTPFARTSFCPGLKAFFENTFSSVTSPGAP